MSCDRTRFKAPFRIGSASRLIWRRTAEPVAWTPAVTNRVEAMDFGPCFRTQVE